MIKTVNGWYLPQTNQELSGNRSLDGHGSPKARKQHYYRLNGKDKPSRLSDFKP